MQWIKRQQGAVLILMFMALVLFALSVFVVNFNPAQHRAEKDAKTLRAMLQAKQLLLSYAARPHGRESDSSSEDRELQLARPGELPCPDADNSGQSTFPNFDYVGANCRYKVAWFPWETLDSKDLFDSESVELWFAVAEGFFNKSGLGAYNEPVINYRTPTTMTLDGRPVVAVLLSTGRPFSHQLQRHIRDAAIAQSSYLEQQNADTNNDEFVSQVALGDFNDIVMGISLNELLAAVEKQAAMAIAKRLNQYFIDNYSYPYADDGSGNCDIALMRISGDVPLDCPGVPSAEPSLPFPASSATDAIDVWVVRNQWLPLFNYERLANNRMRLSTRTPNSTLRPIEFENALQLRL